MGRIKLVREGNKEWDKAPAGAGAFLVNYIGFAYSGRLQGGEGVV